MNGFKVRYRGGPMAGRIEMSQYPPPRETMKYAAVVKHRSSKMNFYSMPTSPRAYPVKQKYGVYSQVYTRLKDDSILMVWVEQ